MLQEDAITTIAHVIPPMLNLAKETKLPKSFEEKESMFNDIASGAEGNLYDKGKGKLWSS